MTKERKITLNSDKRKVIADQFQSFYEDKVKDKLDQAKQQYDLMRIKAKEQIKKVVRFHQPQYDVDTIRSMIKKYNRAGGELYEDNCFLHDLFLSLDNRIVKDYIVFIPFCYLRN